MNEKLQYASMLEIPTTTCNITYKPIKKKVLRSKRKKANAEEIKQQLVEKINAELNAPTVTEENANQTVENSLMENSQTGNGQIDVQRQYQVKPEIKKKRGFSLITLELVIVGLLVATILITNALIPTSGLNTYFKSVLAPEKNLEIVDARTYQDFKPIFNSEDGAGYALTDGIATMQRSGSVYACLDGVVKSLSKNEESGLYSMTITHCDNFSTKIEGLNEVYLTEGSKVYANIPVGYTRQSGSTTCFLGTDGVIISNFEIVDNAVVWAV